MPTNPITAIRVITRDGQTHTYDAKKGTLDSPVVVSADVHKKALELANKARREALKEVTT
ncbi:hypothetical protein [Listeria ilorinensis]|uniref:hypothetical protein n=1 Tax=Listeria ilorinensis TaxID=2867439 RepID=UPI001EF7460D|nr:hypothetical protein [Listeria ilorinensis]